MKAWLGHHLHSLKTALHPFRDAPLATLFTALVIGVAVALPVGLYVLLGNLERAAGGVKPDAEVTLFLKSGIGEPQGRELASRLGRDADVADVRFISRTEGIDKLEALGLADITAGLPENPLPHTLVLKPREENPQAMEALATRLRGLPESDRVLLDTDWVKRLAALMDLGQDLVFMLSAVLGLALAAITANTIRLQIYARRDEIEVARLIGATDRFIRRPFLYFGGLQGLVGGLAGWALVLLGLALIEGSVQKVATAYGASFPLHGLGPLELTVVLTLSMILGWLGAFFAVGQTLRKLESTL
ncbi:MAG TPA: permease-like cell division protein FtsX [Thiobacillaceae bacterium]|nr:permease-like cell division protein FtsX [Thiobacillaceae bacterium]HNU64787.1 permease-like cell division protein FtsX [Thiobacillaceae bacterium]